MPLGEALDDDYVANLLKRDAETHRSRSALGLPSTSSPRVRAKDAPKPNTRFLRNIIRETDSHNAALKAKEEEESRLRLRELKKSERSGKREREEGDEERTGKKVKSGERDGRWASAFGGLGKAEKISGSKVVRGGARVRSKDHQAMGSRSEWRNSRPEDSTHTAKRDHEERSRRAEPKHVKEQRQRNRSVSNGSRSPPARRKNDTTAHDDAELWDSDPLDAVIGPRPAPRVRARGRGAQNAHMPSTIDSRFSSDYDPATDVALNDDEADRDDWDMALEALRDRTKWKTNQAERLKAAGFTDEEVGRWKKGGERGEKDVEDVRWKKKGDGREWDRGKVVDEERRVETKAEWAR
ncbi:hypothetical protein LTR91_005274 [Friedmanniomyces endolithicus]|uniref:Pre-mRNA-splicing factor 38B n=1 Tax=Friedmanniomyces endolithicus TaxID=329885 RepID=A0AAN6KU99_9PEZI|nr:hypothetical protein LTR94_009674 [Friedmanniomyces endolithicus]KAK0791524.1 hypothetical protein LTR59_008917 [Friedmanniomyces endolithicus]KAK0808264.1 hypothetical protein LTR75_006328 [Friedmanniomyces endolithicus]KAK0810455.1 hypothetical protein LTR38_003940 [Friedmanniomyces endolithicus]KAK0838957.1 hypothetical protein LTR03_011616 [Friedmanniomyces endolithicus]